MAAFGAKYLKYAQISEEAEGALPTYDRTKTAMVGSLVKADLTVNYASGEMYADDRLTEKIDEFVSGSIAAEVDELEDETAVILFGSKIDDATQEKVDSTSDIVPEGGLGYYKCLMKRGIKFYRAYFYPKVKAVMGGDTATTKGSSISFAASPVNFTVMEPESGNWRYTKKFAKEADARAWIDAKLGNVTAPDES